MQQRKVNNQQHIVCQKGLQHKEDTYPILYFGLLDIVFDNFIRLRAIHSLTLKLSIHRLMVAPSGGGYNNSVCAIVEVVTEPVMKQYTVFFEFAGGFTVSGMEEHVL